MGNRQMVSENPVQLLGEAEIVAEFQAADAELVQGLLSLRQVPDESLRQCIRAIVATQTFHPLPERRESSVSTAKHKANQRSRRVVAGAFLGLLVVVLLLLATVPSTRAAVAQMIQRFGLVLVNESAMEPQPTLAPGTPGPVKAVEEVIVVRPTTLEAVQAQVPFPLPLPTLLPEGLEFWSGLVGTGPHSINILPDGTKVGDEPPLQVHLIFKPVDGSIYDPDAALSLDIMDKVGTEGGYAVPARTEENVTVDGHPAVFVQGSWMQVNPGDAENLVWDDTADAVMLSWEADGFTYTLQGYLLGLSLEEFIQIAESVRVPPGTDQ